MNLNQDIYSQEKKRQYIQSSNSSQKHKLKIKIGLKLVHIEF